MKLVILFTLLLAACQTSTIQGEVPTPGTNPTPEPPMIACPTDAKICPDGSEVSREAPDCEFAACPIPDDYRYCETNADCVAATCCHPTDVVNKKYVPDCSEVACTLSCDGPLDCGAGSVSCRYNTCVIISNEKDLSV